METMLLLVLVLAGMLLAGAVGSYAGKKLIKVIEGQKKWVGGIEYLHSASTEYLALRETARLKDDKAKKEFIIYYKPKSSIFCDILGAEYNPEDIEIKNRNYGR